MNCTGCHVPPLQGSVLPSNRGYLFTMITSFIPIMYHSCRCFQTTIYIPYKIFSSDILLMLPPLEFLQIISPLLPWRPQNTGRWHENTPFGMPLSLHYNFGQKTLIRLPSALPHNASTLPSSGHLPATHYVNYWKMFYLDVLLLH